jgi:hypothetical protein
LPDLAGLNTIQKAGEQKMSVDAKRLAAKRLAAKTTGGMSQKLAAHARARGTPERLNRPQCGFVQNALSDTKAPDDAGALVRDRFGS